MSVRAFRGATQLDVDDREHLFDRVSELIAEVLRRNSLHSEDLISIVFTATPDLRSDFPAHAARRSGITDVPLLCAQEIPVEGAMPRVVRLMALAETGLSRDEVRHVYQYGAQALRSDLLQDQGAAGEPDSRAG